MPSWKLYIGLSIARLSGLFFVFGPEVIQIIISYRASGLCRISVFKISKCNIHGIKLGMIQNPIAYILNTIVYIKLHEPHF